jgi:hypothetical protein
MTTKNGWDVPEAQLPALYQAATGLGQDLTSQGFPNAGIVAGQQANFRDGAQKIFMMWTDAAFHNPGDSGSIPYPGPSRDEVEEAILALDPPVVVGISSGLGGVDDLRDMAERTRAIAGPEGVDCNGDGVDDIKEGEPLVCTIAESGAGVSDAIVSLIGAADEVSGVPTAYAGEDVLAECEGAGEAVVTLDGRESFDPDGDELTCEWESGTCRVESPNACVTNAGCPLGMSAVRLRVSDGESISAPDALAVQVVDTVAPQGQITSPVMGACASGAVTVEDSYVDQCGLDVIRRYEPDNGPTYQGEGLHVVTLFAEDEAGNVSEGRVRFVIDNTAPRVSALTTPGMDQSVPRQEALSEYFSTSDDDGAPGDVVLERVLIDGCLVYDGRTYGDGDGLLTDEFVGVAQPMICDVYEACGMTEFDDAIIRVEAEDCAGNIGILEQTVPGHYSVDPGGC